MVEFFTFICYFRATFDIMGHNHNLEFSSDLSYETDEKGERVLVRSIESTHAAYIRFTNKTNRPVDIWWRDFRGWRRLYIRLARGASYDINTFITHPWEFTDAVTKEKYVIDNKTVFRPPNSIGGMMHRTNWNITICMRSLRTTALLFTALRLSHPRDIETLELPREIAMDLEKLMSLFRQAQPLAMTSRD